MKGLEENEFFICKQHIKNNNRFKSCLNELRNQNNEKENRKLNEDEMELEEETPPEAIETTKVIFGVTTR